MIVYDEVFKDGILIKSTPREVPDITEEEITTKIDELSAEIDTLRSQIDVIKNKP